MSAVLIDMIDTPSLGNAGSYEKNHNNHHPLEKDFSYHGCKAISQFSHASRMGKRATP